VTVWRNFEASQMYKICMKQSPSRCLGVVGGSTAEGAGIEQRNYTGTAAMQWQVLQVEAGKYKFQNIGSGKVLDVNGTSIVQRGYTGTAGQKIPVVYFSDQPGWANLKPSSSTNAISADNANDGAAMKLSSNVSPDWAKWGFTALGSVTTTTGSGGTTGTAGTTGSAGTTGAGGSAGAGGSGGSSTFAAGTAYRIAPVASNGGVSIDLSNGSTSNGNFFQLYTTTTGNNNQRMQLMPMGTNWKIVMNTSTNKCLDIDANNGSQLYVFDCDGTNSQSWTVTFDGSAFQLKNVAAGRCLDIPNGNLGNGIRPQMYDCATGNNNQRFLIWASQ
jgi:hypothetical protein